MKTQNIIILALVAIVLIMAAVIVEMSLNNNNPAVEINNTNDTENLTINETENTTADTTNNEKISSDKDKSTKKSSDSNIESETIKENYQAGDGSKYREVTYKDGNIRQYNSKGQLIGSSYDSDQEQLRKYYGDDYAGD